MSTSSSEEKTMGHLGDNKDRDFEYVKSRLDTLLAQYVLHCTALPFKQINSQPRDTL